MAGAKVEYDGWPGEAAARAEFEQAGLPHVMALDVPAVANSPHWHHFDSCFYLLDGELELTDVASGEVLNCRAGTRVTVPARVLHAERSDGYRIFLGTSVPPAEFGDPVDRPPEAL